MSVLHFVGIQDALVNEEVRNPERHEVCDEATRLSPGSTADFSERPTNENNVFVKSEACSIETGFGKCCGSRV